MKQGLFVINCPGSSHNVSNEYNRSITDWAGPKADALDLESSPVLPRAEYGWDKPGYHANHNHHHRRRHHTEIATTETSRTHQLRRQQGALQPEGQDEAGINPLILGTQAHFWEMGWRYLYTTLKASAVARTGGTGWAAATNSRDWAPLQETFDLVWEKTRSRLWPLDSV
eukprot:c53007_g1_i1.p2 GENE.c53007_g1_i1~~c53007_g1_i1.p2  ORF type:complete len:170 (+),score=41.73 c53007_g1_i1:93-602(+)